MLRPLDRTRRDGPLYPGSTRTLRECFDAHHLLIQIDTAFDFAALAADLHQRYHQRLGRPAIHPEVVLRALLLASIYQVPSYRQLCERISENLAWRWFCCLTLDDPIFDHSTVSVFLDRVGSEGLQAILTTLNAALVEAGLFSPRTYLDSSLVPANVRTANLVPRDPEAEPPEAVPEEKVFVVREREDPDAPFATRVLRYQDAAGRLPLPSHDRDARWRTIRGKPVLGYKEHVLADRSGFILARRTTPANVEDVAGALPLLEHVPRPITSLTADAGYRDGVFRHHLQRRGITAYIPLGQDQGGSPASFTDHYDHFVCPKGKKLWPSGVPDEHHIVRYAARAKDCRPCPLRTSCVAPSRAAKDLSASRYRVTFAQARRRNATRRYEREQRRRKTVVEGVFARLDRLGGTRTPFRGLERVDGHAALTAITHNILKALTKRRFWHRDAGALAPSARHRLPGWQCLAISPHQTRPALHLSAVNHCYV